jgi:hypothetical protein
VVDLTSAWRGFVASVGEWGGVEAGMDIRAKVFRWDQPPAVAVVDYRAAISDDLEEMLGSPPPG